MSQQRADAVLDGFAGFGGFLWQISGPWCSGRTRLRTIETVAIEANRRIEFNLIDTRKYRRTPQV
jgi:hypothetical protein